MKTLDHHLYILESKAGTHDQALQFIEKGPVEGSATMVTKQDGTTNEEVLRVVIDRVRSQNEKFPCRENSIVLTHLETALLWIWALDNLPETGRPAGLRERR